MVFTECSFQDFKRRIHGGKRKIICYGAGMLPLYIGPLFSQHGLLPKICMFIDSNPEKKGQKILCQGREFLVEAPEVLGKLPGDDYILLITAEKYKEILHGLEKYICLEDWECYAYPLLNLSYFRSMERSSVDKMAEACSFGKGVSGAEAVGAGIPRVIHSIWFGGKEKGELHEKCMESWKRYCPGYTIQEWSEADYDVKKNKYMKQAYECGKWAYVSDYARLDILHTYGGVYFDTDVELKKPIDGLLFGEAFLCFGEWPAPNSGAGAGCVKGNGMIGEMLEERERLSFIQENGNGDPHTNSNYEMQVLMRHGFRMDFTCQSREGFVLLPPDIIAPASITGKDSFVTERTVGMHYCNNSWRAR